MKLKTILTVVAAVLCLQILLACPARADKAEFFETYGYGTAVKGELEVELWNDVFNTAARNDTEEEHAGHQISVEYGITDRWMAEIYGVWRDNPTGKGLQYTQTRLETRYRLGDYHPNAINTALYLDYENKALPGVRDELEGKLIFSRDFGPLNLTANAIFIKDLAAGSKLEFGYAGGLSYPVSRDAVVSLETLVRPSDRQVFLIPGVHFPLGKDTWAGVGVSFETSPAPLNTTLRTFFAHEF